MKSKSLIGLTVAALIAAVAALWLSSEREAVTERVSGEPLVPGLKDKLNEVTRVRVEDAESDASVTLVRDQAGWGVEERWMYPADLADLRQKLIALSEATLAEAKTSDPENYAHLGVEDPDSEGAASKRLEMTMPGGSVSIIVGNSNFRGVTTTYVRRSGESQSWAATGNFSMDARPQDWLQKDLVDIGSGSIRKVVLTHPDGDVIELLKESPELPNHSVVNRPDGRELLSPSSGNSIASALASLRLEDVVRRDEFDPGDVEPVTGVYETFDGLRIRTRAWQLGDDERYLELSAEFDPALIQRKEGTQAPPDETQIGDGEAVPGEAASAAESDAPPEEAKATPGEGAAESGDADSVQAEVPAKDVSGDTPVPAEEAPDDPAARAAELQARLDGWVFRVPSYKFSNLTKRLEDLLKPLDQPEEE